jgi:hypothetical protein
MEELKFHLSHRTAPYIVAKPSHLTTKAIAERLSLGKEIDEFEEGTIASEPNPCLLKRWVVADKVALNKPLEDGTRLALIKVETYDAGETEFGVRCRPSREVLLSDGYQNSDIGLIEKVSY